MRRSQSGSLIQSSPRSASTPSQESGVQESGADKQTTADEGELYLSTACVMPGDNYNILEWWRSQETIYPRLAQVAKDVLAIPIAEVGVERVFNTSKDVIGDRRHRLKARTVQQLMVLKDAISYEDDDIGVSSDEDDDEAQYDEVTEMLQPPIIVPVETITVDDGEEEYVEISNHEEEVRPLRKRQRPARYRE